MAVTDSAPCVARWPGRDRARRRLERGRRQRPEDRPQRQRSGVAAGDGGALVAFQPEGDIEDEVERLKGAGVEFSGEMSEHRGRIVPFKDPDGNDLQLYAPPA